MITPRRVSAVAVTLAVVSVSASAAHPDARAPRFADLHVSNLVVGAGERTKISGRVRRSRHHVRVKLQERRNAHWRVVAAHRLSGGSTFSFSYRPRGVGGHLLRLVLAGSGKPRPRSRVLGVVVRGKRRVRSQGKSLRVRLGGVEVVAPKGAIRKGETLSISTGVAGAGPASKTSIAGGPYGFDTSQGEPDKPVTVRMQYDRGLLTEGSKPQLVHDVAGNDRWVPEPTSVEGAVASATLDSFSLADVLDSGTYWAGMVTGNRSELPKDCVQSPSWVEGVFFPRERRDPLPTCFVRGTDDAKAVVRLVNNRGYAQTIRVTGVKIDVKQSIWGSSLESTAANVLAARTPGDSSSLFIIAPGSTATVTIKRPPSHLSAIRVQFTSLASSTRAKSAFGAIAWAFLTTVEEELGTFVDLENCVIAVVYNAVSSNRGESSALNQMRSCASSANGLADHPKKALSKLAKALLVDDFFYKLVDIQADGLFTLPIEFAIPGSGTANPSIHVGPHDLGQLPAGQQTIAHLEATGGRRPYKFHFATASLNRGEVPSWVKLAPDGTLTIAPPANVSRSVSFSAYVFDSTGQHSPFTRDTVRFEVGPSPGGGGGGGDSFAWSAPEQVTPAGGGYTYGNIFQAISCASTSLCVAVDDAGNAFVSTSPLSGTWSGSLVDPQLDAYDWPCVHCIRGVVGQNGWIAGTFWGSSGLVDVSCPSVSLCVAVDADGNVVSSTDPAAGADAWTVDKVDGDHVIRAVACPTASFCVAGDTDGNILTSTDPAGDALSWDVTPTRPGRQITEIDCPTVSRCFATDSGMGGATFLATSAPAGGSSAWSTVRDLYDYAGAGMSCPSVSLCVVNSGDGTVLSSTEPANPGGTWDSEFISGTDGPPGSHWPMGVGVSCASDSFCAVSGGSFDAWTSSNPTGGPSAWKRARTSWVASDLMTSVACLSPTACFGTDLNGALLSSGTPSVSWDGNAVDKNRGLRAVSCTLPLRCVAMDVQGDAFSSVNPAGGASTWRRVHVAENDVPLGLSCQPTLCVGTNTIGTALRSANPFAPGATWSDTGLSWINAAIVDPDVACPSAGLCVVVDGDEHVLSSTNPSAASPTWRSTGVEPDGRSLKSVACATTSLCVATDDRGYVLTSTNPADGVWSAPTKLTAGRALNDVSCTPDPLCVALGADGRVFTSTAPAAPAHIWSASQVESTDDALERIFCASKMLCAALDREGRVTVSTDPPRGAPSWSALEPVDQRGGLADVSCAGGSCVAVDRAGGVVVGAG